MIRFNNVGAPTLQAAIRDLACGLACDLARDLAYDLAYDLAGRCDHRRCAFILPTGLYRSGRFG